MKLFTKLFSKRNPYEDVVKLIGEREETFAHFSDEQLKQKSEEYKKRTCESGTLSKDVIVDAFGLIREAAKRTLQQRPYDEQLMGAMALVEGKIVEMKTGEGKTLAATAPVYAHALLGKGVHVITVNDYLAQRDAVWMGQIYYMLGLSVGCLTHEQAFVYDADYRAEDVDDSERDSLGSFRVVHDFLRPVPRSEAYKADITYGTNHEFGFDYLRDNLAYSSAQRVQRGHYFALIDEVDSVLIDEARTPMIISGPDKQAAQYYKVFAGIVGQLKSESDYVVDEKAKNVTMTEEGIDKVEKILGIDNLYDPQYMQMVHYLEESLKAHALFVHDRHYVVKKGEVIIVDEFTGRLMPGRRFSGGLHQALEAKEGVSIREESKTFAQVTIQNYFRMYKILAGMTGTAVTSAEEFTKVYGLNVVSIPTHAPMIRVDYPDRIYKTLEAKYSAVVDEVQKRNKKEQPILIGTTSVEENELLSERLKQAGVSHEVLNAKNHEREGEIIAQAGKPSAVTLATNIAGRGVDIVLGGNPSDAGHKQRVKDGGGLFVLGTQRNEARRVDNQLRGRSGRQGDPGESQFFLSLEDDMLRVFGGERVARLMETLKIPDDQAIESGMVVKVVGEAQKKVEGVHFDIRKHLLEYDDVLNKQRTTIYKRRQTMLERVEKGEVSSVLEEITQRTLSMQYEAFRKAREEGQNVDIQVFFTWLSSVGLLPKGGKLSESELDEIEHKVLPKLIKDRISEVASDEKIGVRVLASLDIFWTNHLENAEALLESVRMRAYGQKDPLVEYKRESYELFKDLIANAEGWVVSTVFMSSDTVQRVLSPKSDAGFGKVGRNDPCPCGSGKKYKKCHGA